MLVSYPLSEIPAGGGHNGGMGMDHLDMDHKMRGNKDRRGRHDRHRLHMDRERDLREREREHEMMTDLNGHFAYRYSTLEEVTGQVHFLP